MPRCSLFEYCLQFEQQTAFIQPNNTMVLLLVA